MCGSDELIHDARQVDLEEMIMTKDVQYYLVPGRLTKDQKDTLYLETHMGDCDAAIRSIGTPIQPCADVETACWITPGRIAFLRDQRINPKAAYASAGATPISTAPYDVPLVRRTDMEAQVAVWKQRYERIRRRFLQDANDEARTALNKGAAG